MEPFAARPRTYPLTMDRTDVALILAAFSALTILGEATAAPVITAFVAGLLHGHHRQPTR